MREIRECLAAGIRIEKAIICCRPLDDVVDSRIRVQGDRTGKVPGGLMATENPSKQAEVLARLFFDLVYSLSAADVPMTFLHYPRFASDHGYGATMLARVFPEIPVDRWRRALEQEVRDELIRSRRTDPPA